MTSGEMELVSVAGPTRVSLTLTPPEQAVIGRRSTCELVLDAPVVSRQHAVVSYSQHSSIVRKLSDRAQRQGVWIITDLSSRHGSRVNGVRVEPNRPCPLCVGDLIEIGAWTLRAVDPSAPASPSQTIVRTIDDSVTTGRLVRPVEHRQAGVTAQRRLDALLLCAGEMRDAADEQALSQVVLDAAVSGGGFANAAFLRALHDDGSVEVTAHRGEIEGPDGQTRLSRSLIAKASGGIAAHIVGSSQSADQQSIVQYDISEAVCAPLLVSNAVEGFLYVDRRGGQASHHAPDDLEFICGLAKLASLALADQRRLQLERRQAQLDADLVAAGEAHRWILPPLRGKIGAVSYAGRSKPGRSGLGGDFFDVLDVGDGRVAAALGDVTGKGVSAAILMTAAQGFLHAALLQHCEPALAATDLNKFLCPRVGPSRFLTLWVGVFDVDAGELKYVDAGHGHALLFGRDGDSRPLTDASNPLLGIDPNAVYTSERIAMNPGENALIVSDGLIEQPANAVAGQRRREFGIDAVGAAVRAAGDQGDAVAALFDAVTEHAGTDHLADDATALLVRW